MKKGNYATLKIYEPSGVCVINMNCGWIESSIYKEGIVFPKFSKKIMPQGGWKPNTEYRCEFLNSQKRGLKWTIKTTIEPKINICLDCWQLNLSKPGQICQSCG